MVIAAMAIGKNGDGSKGNSKGNSKATDFLILIFLCYGWQQEQGQSGDGNSGNSFPILQSIPPWSISVICYSNA